MDITGICSERQHISFALIPAYTECEITSYVRVVIGTVVSSIYFDELKRV